MKIPRLTIALGLLALPLACTAPEPTLPSSAPARNSGMTGSGNDTTVVKPPTNP